MGIFDKYLPSQPVINPQDEEDSQSTQQAPTILPTINRPVPPPPLTNKSMAQKTQDKKARLDQKREELNGSTGKFKSVTMHVDQVTDGDSIGGDRLYGVNANETKKNNAFYDDEQYGAARLRQLDQQRLKRDSALGLPFGTTTREEINNEGEVGKAKLIAKLKPDSDGFFRVNVADTNLVDKSGHNRPIKMYQLPDGKFLHNELNTRSTNTEYGHFSNAPARARDNAARRFRNKDAAIHEQNIGKFGHKVVDTIIKLAGGVDFAAGKVIGATATAASLVTRGKSSEAQEAFFTKTQKDMQNVLQSLEMTEIPESIEGVIAFEKEFKKQGGTDEQLKYIDGQELPSYTEAFKKISDQIPNLSRTGLPAGESPERTKAIDDLVRGQQKFGSKGEFDALAKSAELTSFSGFAEDQSNRLKKYSQTFEADKAKIDGELRTDFAALKVAEAVKEFKDNPNSKAIGAIVNNSFNVMKGAAANVLNNKGAAVGTMAESAADMVLSAVTLGGAVATQTLDQFGKADRQYRDKNGGKAATGKTEANMLALSAAVGTSMVLSDKILTGISKFGPGGLTKLSHAKQKRQFGADATTGPNIPKGRKQQFTQDAIDQGDLILKSVSQRTIDALPGKTGDMIRKAAKTMDVAPVRLMRGVVGASMAVGSGSVMEYYQEMFESGGEAYLQKVMGRGHEWTMSDYLEAHSAGVAGFAGGAVMSVPASGVGLIKNHTGDAFKTAFGTAGYALKGTGATIGAVHSKLAGNTSLKQQLNKDINSLADDTTMDPGTKISSMTHSSIVEKLVKGTDQAQANEYFSTLASSANAAKANLMSTMTNPDVKPESLVAVINTYEAQITAIKATKNKYAQEFVNKKKLINKNISSSEVQQLVATLGTHGSSAKALKELESLGLLGDLDGNTRQNVDHVIRLHDDLTAPAADALRTKGEILYDEVAPNKKKSLLGHIETIDDAIRTKDVRAIDKASMALNNFAQAHREKYKRFKAFAEDPTAETDGVLKLAIPGTGNKTTDYSQKGAESLLETMKLEKNLLKSATRWSNSATGWTKDVIRASRKPSKGKKLKSGITVNSDFDYVETVHSVHNTVSDVLNSLTMHTKGIKGVKTTYKQIVDKLGTRGVGFLTETDPAQTDRTKMNNFSKKGLDRAINEAISVLEALPKTGKDVDVTNQDNIHKLKEAKKKLEVGRNRFYYSNKTTRKGNLGSAYKKRKGYSQGELGWAKSVTTHSNVSKHNRYLKNHIKNLYNTGVLTDEQEERAADFLEDLVQSEDGISTLGDFDKYVAGEATTPADARRSYNDKEITSRYSTTKEGNEVLQTMIDKAVIPNNEFSHVEKFIKAMHTPIEITKEVMRLEETDANDTSKFRTVDEAKAHLSSVYELATPLNKKVIEFVLTLVNIPKVNIDLIIEKMALEEAIPLQRIKMPAPSSNLNGQAKRHMANYQDLLYKFNVTKMISFGKEGTNAHNTFLDNPVTTNTATYVNTDVVAVRVNASANVVKDMLKANKELDMAINAGSDVVTLQGSMRSGNQQKAFLKKTDDVFRSTLLKANYKEEGATGLWKSPKSTTHVGDLYVVGSAIGSNKQPQNRIQVARSTTTGTDSRQGIRNRLQPANKFIGFGKKGLAASDIAEDNARHSNLQEYSEHDVIGVVAPTMGGSAKRHMRKIKDELKFAIKGKATIITNNKDIRNGESYKGTEGELARWMVQEGYVETDFGNGIWIPKTRFVKKPKEGLNSNGLPALKLEARKPKRRLKAGYRWGPKGKMVKHSKEFLKNQSKAALAKEKAAASKVSYGKSSPTRDADVARFADISRLIAFGKAGSAASDYYNQYRGKKGTKTNYVADDIVGIKLDDTKEKTTATNTALNKAKTSIDIGAKIGVTFVTASAAEIKANPIYKLSEKRVADYLSEIGYVENVVGSGVWTKGIAEEIPVNIHTKGFTAKTIKDFPDHILVFDESINNEGSERVGTGTASVRGDVNAVGLITKKVYVYKEDLEGDFIEDEHNIHFEDTDEDYRDFVTRNTEILKELKVKADAGDKILFPNKLGGTFQKLPPRFSNWLKAQLLADFDVTYETNEENNGLDGVPKIPKLQGTAATSSLGLKQLGAAFKDDDARLKELGTDDDTVLNDLLEKQDNAVDNELSKPLTPKQLDAKFPGVPHQYILKGGQYEATTDQKALIDAGEAFLNEDGKKALIIQGKGGTGKTSVIAQILANSLEGAGKKHLYMGAVAHTAKQILEGSSKLLEGQLAGKVSVDYNVLAGLLSFKGPGATVKKQFQAGGKELQPSKALNQIIDAGSAAVLVVDEMSMVDELQYHAVKLIMAAGGKVIFMGDYHQLPTVDNNKLSVPVHNMVQALKSKKGLVNTETEAYYELTEIKRQENGSAILDLADHYADNVEVELGIKEEPEAKGKAIGNIIGSDEVIFGKAALSIKAIARELTMSVNSVWVGFTNKSTEDANIKIRTELFGKEEAKNEYVVGEKLISHGNEGTNFKRGDGRITNSMRFTVTEVTTGIAPKDVADQQQLLTSKQVGHDVYGPNITISDEITYTRLRVYNESTKEYNTIYQPDGMRNAVDAIAKKSANKTTGAQKKFASAYSAALISMPWFSATVKAGGTTKKATFLADKDLEEFSITTGVKLNYGYAITAHKSQGSTYDTVYMEPHGTGDRIANQLNYTMSTRATTRVVLIRDDNVDLEIGQGLFYNSQHPENDRKYTPKTPEEIENQKYEDALIKMSAVLEQNALIDTMSPELLAAVELLNKAKTAAEIEAAIPIYQKAFDENYEAEQDTDERKFLRAKEAALELFEKIKKEFPNTKKMATFQNYRATVNNALEIKDLSKAAELLQKGYDDLVEEKKVATAYKKLVKSTVDAEKELDKLQPTPAFVVDALEKLRLAVAKEKDAETIKGLLQGFRAAIAKAVKEQTETDESVDATDADKAAAILTINDKLKEIDKPSTKLNTLITSIKTAIKRVKLKVLVDAFLVEHAKIVTQEKKDREIQDNANPNDYSEQMQKDILAFVDLGNKADGITVVVKGVGGNTAKKLSGANPLVLLYPTAEKIGRLEIAKSITNKVVPALDEWIDNYDDSVNPKKGFNDSSLTEAGVKNNNYAVKDQLEDESDTVHMVRQQVRSSLQDKNYEFSHYVRELLDNLFSDKGHQYADAYVEEIKKAVDFTIQEQLGENMDTVKYNTTILKLREEIGDVSGNAFAIEGAKYGMTDVFSTSKEDRIKLSKELVHITSTKQMLAWAIKNAPTQGVREALILIQGSIPRTSITTIMTNVNDDPLIAGSMTSDLSSLKLYVDPITGIPNFSYKDIVHELLHFKNVRTLDKKLNQGTHEAEAYAGIEKLIEKTRVWLKDPKNAHKVALYGTSTYGLSNPKEFFSEIISNPVFAQMLHSIKITEVNAKGKKKPAKTLLSMAKGFFRKLFAVENINGTTVFDQGIELVGEAFAVNPEIAERVESIKAFKQAVGTVTTKEQVELGADDDVSTHSTLSKDELQSKTLELHEEIVSEDVNFWTDLDGGVDNGTESVLMPLHKSVRMKKKIGKSILSVFSDPFHLDNASLIQDYMGLDEDHMLQLATLREYVELFSENIDKVSPTLDEDTTNKQSRDQNDNRTLTSKGTISKAPYYMLFGKSGESADMHPNVKAAMAIAFHKWIIERGNSTLNNFEKDVNMLIGNKPDDAVHPDLVELLGGFGSAQSTIAFEIGMEVVKQLNLEGMGTGVDGNFVPRLALSLGNSALAAAENLQLVEFEAVENTVLDNFRSDTSKTPSANTNFVHLASNQNKGNGLFIPTDRAKRLQEVGKETGDLTKILFKPKSHVVKPLRKEPTAKDIEVKLNGTVLDASKRALKSALNMAKDSYKPIQRNFENFAKFSDNGQLSVVGYNHNVESRHAYEHVGINGKNAGLVDDLKAVKDFHDEGKVRGENIFETSLYFPMRFWKNIRQGIVGNQINMQSSKYARFMFGATKWRKTYKLSNKQHMYGFSLGIIQALDLKTDDSGTDKQKLTALKKDALLDNPETTIGKGLAVIMRTINHDDSYTEEQEEIVLAAIDDGGENTHTYDGLLNLAELLNAEINGDKNITVSITLETDGTTNGSAISMHQLSTYLDEKRKNFFRAVGYLFQGDEDTTYKEWAARPGNNDNYQNVTVEVEQLVRGHLDADENIHFNKLVDKFMPQLIEYTESLGTVVTKDGRSFSKDAFMTSVYSKGQKQVAKDTAKVLVTAIYEFISDNQDDPAALVELDTLLNGYLQDHINGLKKIDKLLKAPDASTEDGSKAIFLAAKAAGVFFKKSDSLKAKQNRIASELKKQDDVALAMFSDVEKEDLLTTFMPNPMEASLLNTMADTYGESMNGALEKVLGSFLDTRAIFNSSMRAANEIAIVNLQHEFLLARRAKFVKMTKAGDVKVETNGDTTKEIELTQKEEDAIVRRLVEEGKMATLKHATSEGFTDSIMPAKTEKVRVEEEQGGKVQQSYGKIRPTRKVVTSYNPDAKRGSRFKIDGTKTSFRSVSGHVRKTHIIGDNGITSQLMSTLATDGNMVILQGEDSSKTFVNIHDAQLWSAMEAIKRSNQANELYDGLMNDFDLMGEVKSTLDRMAKVRENIMKGKDKELIEKMEALDERLYGTKLDVNDELVLADPKGAIRANKKIRDFDADTDRFGNYPWVENHDTQEGQGSIEEVQKRMTEEHQSTLRGRSLIKRYAVYLEQFGNDGNGHIIADRDPTLAQEYIDNYAEPPNDTDDIYSKIEITSSDSTRTYGTQAGALEDQEFINAEANVLNARNVGGILVAAEAKDVEHGIVVSPEHKKTLNGVVNNLVKPVLRMIDGVNLMRIEKGDTNMGIIKGKNVYIKAAVGMAKSPTAMGEQETLVHELVHPVWDLGLKKDKAAYSKISRLFNYVRKHEQPITARELAGPTSTTEEQADAQEFLDYVFDSAHIYEFATFGLTNERFIEVLSRFVPPNMDINKVETPFDILHNTFAKLFNNATSKKAVSTQLAELADNLTIINKTHSIGTGKYNPFSDAANEKVANILSTKVYDKILRWAQDHPTLFGVAKVGGRTGDLALLAPARLLMASASVTATVLLSPSLGPKLYEIGDSIVQGKLRILTPLTNELKGTTNENRPYHKLLTLSKHYVDSAAKAVGVGLAKDIDNRFGQYVPTEDEWDAMNSVLLDADLHVLAAKYPSKMFSGVLESKQIRGKKIMAVRAMIDKKFPQHKHFYKIQAENLGHILVRGTGGLRNTLLNAEAIATVGVMESTHRDKPQNLSKKDHKEAVALIDELASLHAIGFADAGKREMVAELFRNQEETNQENNGVLYLMDMHRAMQDEAKRNLFNGNGISMRKGYTTDLTDPNIAVQVGLPEHELLLKKKGFVPITKLEKDDIDANSQEQLLYLNKDAGMSKYMAGIMSLDTRTTTGTDVVGMAKAELGMYDYESTVEQEMIDGLINEMADASIGSTVKQLKGTETLDFSKSFMVPSIGHKGGVVNYRYMMSHKNKEKLLRKRTNARDVLAATTASVTKKHKGNDYNKRLSSLLINDYVANGNPDGKPNKDFVSVSATSKNKAHREAYKLIPENIRKQFPNEEVMIRHDVIDLTLGMRKLSIANLIKTDKGVLGSNAMAIKKIIHHAESIWQGVVGTAKRNVVIYTPDVLINNQLSNMGISVMKGVPPMYTAKMQLEATVEMRKYKKLIAKRDTLVRKSKEKLSTKEYTARQLANRKTNRDKRIKRLDAEIRNNPVHDLVKEGMFQTIVEDIAEGDTSFINAVDSALYSSNGKLHKALATGLKSIKEKTGGGKALGVKALKTAYITPDLGLARDLRDATQISDFAARYALHKYNTEVKGMSHEESLEDATETFINYEWNSSAGLQYLNDMGILMYTKFLFRIQKVIMKAFRDKPINAYTSLAIQGAIYDIPLPHDAFLPGKIGTSNVANFGDIADQATDMSLFHYVPLPLF